MLKCILFVYLSIFGYGKIALSEYESPPYGKSNLRRRLAPVHVAPHPPTHGTPHQNQPHSMLSPSFNGGRKSSMHVDSRSFISRPDSRSSMSRADSLSSISRADSRSSMSRADSLSSMSRAESIPPLRSSDSISSISLPPLRKSESISSMSRAESIPPLRSSESLSSISRAESIPPLRKSDSISSISRADSLSPLPHADSHVNSKLDPLFDLNFEPPASSARIDSPGITNRTQGYKKPPSGELLAQTVKDDIHVAGVNVLARVKQFGSPAKFLRKKYGLSDTIRIHDNDLGPAHEAGVVHRDNDLGPAHEAGRPKEVERAWEQKESDMDFNSAFAPVETFPKLTPRQEEDVAMLLENLYIDFKDGQMRNMRRSYAKLPDGHPWKNEAFGSDAVNSWARRKWDEFTQEFGPNHGEVYWEEAWRVFDPQQREEFKKHLMSEERSTMTQRDVLNANRRLIREIKGEKRGAKMDEAIRQTYGDRMIVDRR